MINVKVSRKAGHIQSVELTGHAGFAEHGKDIVCAAVSALAIHTVNALIEVAHLDISVEVDQVEGGYLAFAMPILTRQEQEKADLLLNSFVLSLSQIKEEHNQYIQIKEN